MTAPLRYALCLLLLVPNLASGAQVIWGSSRLANNYTSQGAPNRLDGSFTFQLGSFANDFTPTASNTSEWLEHWVAAQSATYNETTRFFTGSYVYTDTVSPFTPSNRGYIWGFNERRGANGASVGEWILITDLNWQWPAGGGIALPVQWSVSSASEVVLGSVGGSGADFHMRTAAVALEAGGEDTPQTWIADFFTGPDADLTADPDFDGLTNLMEFALQTPPNEANGGRMPMLEINDAATEVVFFKAGARAGVTFELEVSEDLLTWQSGDRDYEVVAESFLGVRFRSRHPLGEGPPYARVVAVVP